MSRVRALVLTGSWVLGFSAAIAGWWFLDPPDPRTRVLTLMLAVMWLVGVALVLLLLPRVHFRHARYALDRRGLDIRGGALWRRAVAVPRARLQHADVTQGPIERWFGLATLVVHTAGFSEGAIVLNGIDHARAIAMRDLLLEDAGTDPV